MISATAMRIGMGWGCKSRGSWYNRDIVTGEITSRFTRTSATSGRTSGGILAVTKTCETVEPTGKVTSTKSTRRIQGSTRNAKPVGESRGKKGSIPNDNRRATSISSLGRLWMEGKVNKWA